MTVPVPVTLPATAAVSWPSVVVTVWPSTANEIVSLALVMVVGLRFPLV